MDWSERTRRAFLKQFGAAGAAALAAANADGLALAQDSATQPAPTAADQKQAATREARMAWWHEAKFGMFIHWGLYSVIGQHEWAKEDEGVPLSAIRAAGQTLSSQAQRRARLGSASQTRRPEVHGDDDQASRGLLQLGHATDRLQRHGPGARARPGARVCRSRPRRRAARGLLLLADGLAPPGRRDLQDRRSRAAAFCRLHARPHPRADDQLRQDRHSLVRRRVAARRQSNGNRSG